MRSIAYMSGQCVSPDSEDFVQSLRNERGKNHRKNVTGLMVHIDGYTLEVLEGEAPLLEARLKDVHADPKLFDVRLLVDLTILKRAFSGYRISVPSLDTMYRHEGLVSLPQVIAQAKLSGQENLPWALVCWFCTHPLVAVGELPDRAN